MGGQRFIPRPPKATYFQATKGNLSSGHQRLSGGKQPTSPRKIAPVFVGYCGRWRAGDDCRERRTTAGLLRLYAISLLEGFPCVVARNQCDRHDRSVATLARDRHVRRHVDGHVCRHAFIHVYRHVCTHVSRHLFDMCIGMCLDRCEDVCLDMCIDVCVEMCRRSIFGPSCSTLEGRPNYIGHNYILRSGP